MNNALVRKRILQEHQSLRHKLQSLEDSVYAMCNDPSTLSAVTDTACTLLQELGEHTQLEDAILAPALFGLDAWGPVRASMLLEHHALQRSELRSLVDSYTAKQTDPPQVVRMTLNWISEVRADMQHEERDILNNALLLDEVVAVDMECG